MTITPEQYEDVRRVFQQARGLTRDEADRCINDSLDDDDLRELARSLLHEHDVQDSFLETDASPPTTAHAQSLKPGDLYEGRYRIERELGRGGMGIVMLGRQVTPVDRHVAIKLLRTGWPSESWLRRFDLERQALAAITHPGIARMYDAGVDVNGSPFVVMEHIDGLPITQHCEEQSLSLDDRIHLFLQVCEAVQHAHQKGFVHRDIKPSNILVRNDGSRGQPIVIDFGIAKALSDITDPGTLVTQEGQMLGTPGYMSPEQETNSRDGVDTRSDIYSLGVVLYEILTGVLPGMTEDGPTVSRIEASRAVDREEITRPSARVRQTATSAVVDSKTGTRAALARQVAGDLDWITLKALEFEPPRRYASAAEFADDIRRYQAGQPVLAGPPTFTYRMRKFARRNSGLVAAGTVGLLALIIGLIGTTTGFVRAERQRIAAVEAQKESDQQRRVADQARLEAEAVADFLTHIIDSPNVTAMGRDVTMLDAIRNAEAEVAREFADSPLLEATARHTIGTTLAAFSELDAAEANLRRAYEIRTEVLGEEHPDTIETIGEMSHFFLIAGQPEMATAFGERAAGLSQRILGMDHSNTIAIVNNLALCYQAQSRYEDAVTQLNFALEGYRRMHGDEHEFTLQARVNLAITLGFAGQTDDAIGHAEQIIQIAEAANQPDMDAALMAEHLLGKIEISEDRIAEAETRLKALIPRFERVYGENHRNVIALLTDIGSMYSDLRRGDVAIDYLRTAYERSIASLGDRHPDTLNAGLFYAINLARYGPETAEEAERLYLVLLPLHEDTYGHLHDRTAAIANNLGQLYRRLGRLDDAERLIVDAYERRLEIFGEDSRQVMSSESTLASLYFSMGKMEESHAMYEKTAERHARLMGMEDWRTLDVLFRLGQSHLRVGNIDEGFAMMEDIESRNPSVLGEGDRRTQTARRRLAELYLDHERFDEAAAMAARAHDGLLEHMPTHPNMRAALVLLIDIYETWGREADVAHWESQLLLWEEENDWDRETGRRRTPAAESNS